MRNVRNVAILAGVILAAASMSAADVLLDTGGFEGFATGSVEGQNGWTGNMNVYDLSTHEFWAGAYPAGAPGKGLASQAREARRSLGAYTDANKACQVDYSMYLCSYGANVISVDMQIEQFAGSGNRSFPVTVRVTNDGNGTAFKVQAIKSDVGGTVDETMYDSQADDDLLFYSSEKTRLDISVTFNLKTDSFDLSITQWTPATWIAGEPVRTININDIAAIPVADNDVTMVLRFIGRLSGSNATMIDNVVVQSVPEPGTISLLVGGLGCLLARGRRK